MPSFRNEFIAGLLLAVGAGAYLFQLWQPERQVRLHSEHLIEAIEEHDWEEAGGFIADSYQDQWGHDRALVLSRLRDVLQYARNLQIDAQEAGFSVSDAEGMWRANIRVEADPNEVSLMIKERVDRLEEPFELALEQARLKFLSERKTLETPGFAWFAGGDQDQTATQSKEHFE